MNNTIQISSTNVRLVAIADDPHTKKRRKTK